MWQALALLSEPEAKFVGYVIAGKNHVEAYRLVHPGAQSQNSARVSAAKIAKRAHVQQALRLGREKGAVAAIAGLTFSIQESFAELGRVLDMAMREKQSSGAAKAAELRAKLGGHLIDRIDQRHMGSFEIRISGIYDDPPKVINPVTIEHDPSVDPTIHHDGR